MKNIKRQGGFTLVELLVVIGILAVLTAVVLVAVNPVRQFAQARDTQRRADVTTVSAAIIAYLADPNNTNERSLAGLGITESCMTTDDPPVANPQVHVIGQATGMLPLTLLTPTYVAALPFDPTFGSNDDTQYSVCVAGTDATANRFTVAAVHPSEVDSTTTISVTR